jgi:hypothetical protein
MLLRAAALALAPAENDLLLPLPADAVRDLGSVDLGVILVLADLGVDLGVDLGSVDLGSA